LNPGPPEYETGVTTGLFSGLYIYIYIYIRFFKYTGYKGVEM
jgi:hypothetical protein